MGAMTKIGALKIVDPKEWARQVKDALRRHDGHAPLAAEELGCSKRTLLRWLAEEPALAKAKRAANGVCLDYSNAGRPPVEDE